MGMDSVRIVLRIEETFGISIPDEVAPELTTPRKVTDFVITQVERSDRAICLSQRAFHRLRRASLERLSLPRSAFRPAAKLEEMILIPHRKETWLALQADTGLSDWPALLPPKWIRTAIEIISVIGLLTGLLTAGIFWQTADRVSEKIFFVLVALSAVPLCAVKIAWALTLAVRPFQREFPFTTVADLVKYLVAMNPSEFQPVNRWTRESVAAAIRRILIEEAGVENFDEDANLVRDLGID